MLKQVQSGLGIREFVRREGLKDSTFRWWRTELNRSSPSLLPVLIADAAPARPNAIATIVVRVGDIKIKLRGSSCTETAVAIVVALRSDRC